jgi:hypothetical protein
MSSCINLTEPWVAALAESITTEAISQV